MLILTTFDLDEYVFAGLRAGASGFLLKDVPPDDCCRDPHRGRPATPSSRRASPAGCSTRSPPCCPTRRHRAAGPDRRLAALTEREREVLAAGRAGPVEPRDRRASCPSRRRPSRSHVGRMLAKLGLRDRVQAVVFAYETGFVSRGG